jgi:hypothetical protein
MMHKVMWTCLALVACGGDKGGGDSGGADGGGEDAAIQAELDELLGARASWGQLAAWSGVQPSDTMHDAFTQVWLNTSALGTIEAAAGGDLPVGSVAFKESYSDAAGATLTGSTAMYKASDDYGWFFASYDASGGLKQSGRMDMCIGCHEAGQDHILVTTW